MKRNLTLLASNLILIKQLAILIYLEVIIRISILAIVNILNHNARILYLRLLFLHLIVLKPAYLLLFVIKYSLLHICICNLHLAIFLASLIKRIRLLNLRLLSFLNIILICKIRVAFLKYCEVFFRLLLLYIILLGFLLFLAFAL